MVSLFLLRIMIAVTSINGNLQVCFLKYFFERICETVSYTLSNFNLTILREETNGQREVSLKRLLKGVDELLDCVAPLRACVSAKLLQSFRLCAPLAL